MNFLNPSAAWFLLVIPPVIILYFMKLRRKEYRTTASFLWKKVISDARVDSFFQKLRVNILLVLQILLLLFLVAALARPFFASFEVMTAETILILDTSASMKTREGNRTRLDQAKEKINRILDEAPSGSSFMLITSGDSAQLRSGFTTDRDKLRNILSGIKAKDTGTNTRPALLLALSVLKSHPDAGIILVGDKVTEVGDITVSGISNFEFLSVGSHGENIGITDFNIARITGMGKGELFVRVKNFSSVRIDSYLEIYQGNSMIEAREVHLKPGESGEYIFTLSPAYSGIIRAVLPVNDSFSPDNTALGLVRSAREMKVLLASGGNSFLEKAVAVIPDAQVKILPPSNVTPEKAGEYDLVIWYNHSSPAVREGNHIVINGSTPDFPIRGTVEKPTVISCDSRHPIMRYIDLIEIAINKSQVPEAPHDARVLAESDAGPLILLLERGRMRTLFIAFDFMESDWPLYPAFPLFFANAVEYMGSRGGLSPTGSFKTGETLKIDFLPAPGQVIVEAPDRTQETIILDDSGSNPVIPLDQAGIYRIRYGTEILEIPVNLVNEAESDIAPDPPLRNVKLDESGARKTPLLREIWWEIALVVLLILVLEWFVFHRRRS